MRIQLNLHSVVDLITNSSTVIFTYQDSIKEAKDLVTEVLKLSGITDKTADDIFYYGVFVDNYQYLESEKYPEEAPQMNYKNQELANETRIAAYAYLKDLQLSIMKGEIVKPKWMVDVENGINCDYAPNRILILEIKDEKYVELANKINGLLNSVSANGGYDG